MWYIGRKRTNNISGYDATSLSALVVGHVSISYLIDFKNGREQQAWRSKIDLIVKIVGAETMFATQVRRKGTEERHSNPHTQSM